MGQPSEQPSYANESIADALAMNPHLAKSLRPLVPSLKQAILNRDASQVYAALAHAVDNPYFQKIIKDRRILAKTMTALGSIAVVNAASPTVIIVAQAVRFLASSGRTDVSIGIGVLGFILALIGTSTLHISKKIDNRALLRIADEIVKALDETPARRGGRNRE